MSSATDSDLISAIPILKSATLGGLASARLLGGTRRSARHGNDECGTDANRESVDATSTSEILRLKHECGVTDRGIARSLSVAAPSR
jgi:hypothetical protein